MLSHRLRIPAAVAATALAVLLSAPIVAQDGPPRPLDVPYVPTPQVVVDKMLEVAGVKRDDYLIDLGSGDGRIPVTAAERFGTRALGVDLNPVRVREAKAKAALTKVEKLATFEQGDLFKTDITKATVISMYLLPDVNMKLRPDVLKLKPGTRIVSHNFDMEDWKADRTEKVEYSTVYFWVVPANVAGNYRLTVGGETVDMKLEQKFQELTGVVTKGDKTIQVGNGRMNGAAISFSIAMEPDKPITLQGEAAESGRLEGKGWSAVRN